MVTLDVGGVGVIEVGGGDVWVVGGVEGPVETCSWIVDFCANAAAQNVRTSSMSGVLSIDLVITIGLDHEPSSPASSTLTSTAKQPNFNGVSR